MAAKTAGSVSIHRRPFGRSRIAAIAARIPCVSIRANTPIWIRSPIGPRAGGHAPKAACTTRRRDLGAPAPDNVRRVVPADRAKERGARAGGVRPRVIATLAATCGEPEAASLQPRPDA